MLRMLKHWGLKVDFYVERYLQRVRARWPLFDRTVRWIARYGPVVFFAEMFFLCLCSLQTFVVFWQAIHGITVAIVAAVTTKLLVDPLAKRFSRKRPFVTIGYIPLVAKDPLDPSFPSNHAGGAMALATVLIVQFPWFSLFTVSLALAVIFSRLYAGLHYVSDVLAGGAIGTLTAFVYLSVLR